MPPKNSVLDRLQGPLRLGLGGAPLGNLYAPLSDDAALQTIEEAWRLGVRYFDTAPLYGHGQSEVRLGRFLQVQPRDSFVLSTKVGRLLSPDPDPPAERDGYVQGLPFAPRFDYSFDGALRSIDESLQRLGIDRIDIAFIHDIDRHTHGDAQPARFREAMDGAYRALHRLRGEGVLGAIGIGVNEWQACCDALREGDFDCLMLAGRYTLLDTSAAAELVPMCSAKGARLVLAGVFNSGILASANGVAADARFDYRPADRQVRDKAAHIARICNEFGVALPAAALQFALACRSAAAVVVGARSAAEIAQNVAHRDAPIPAALWEALVVEGLLPAGLPPGSWP
ncbi:D-threo-aldose 1-dehydrogenase [Variovorax sp. HW608]|uniref:aldo/keto reductase n=1 Tax=Variovorax sp. HW608 TaxID=1034889 RepID=UPI00081FCE5D|nr:aldo/keto reductase [Variovorax sp. HW608]SCK47683.1 D-threo-aldose 1-dehydrogenase [Variovorax sp. HW608]